MRYLFFLSLLFVISCKEQKQATPSKGGVFTKKKVLVGVKITSIAVNTFPLYGGSGEKWDAYAPFSSDPDIFLKIKWNDNELYQSEVRDECVFGTPVGFSNGLPLAVKVFDQPLLLEVFDEDGISNDDNMGYFTIRLLDQKNMKDIVLKNERGDLSVSMAVEWIYE